MHSLQYFKDYVKKLTSSECLLPTDVCSFYLVATPYCPLVCLDVGTLSKVILFHTHVYHIYNDYICSFQEGNQELYSVDCGEQEDLFNVDREMSSGLQRLLSAQHGFTL